MPQPARNPIEGHPVYEEIRDLGSGSFGFVKLAKNRRTGEQVAIKCMERGSEVTEYVEREILNHRLLLHPHVIQFKEVFVTPSHLCVVLEYAAGGDLFEYVLKRGGLREDEARWFFQQLIVALDYCHRMGVVNRDIKLENTLLDSRGRHPIVKLCDFGYSKMMLWMQHQELQSAPGSRVGTPAYMAPEVILATRGRTYDGKISDVWSAGVMLYVMLVGAYPFERPEDRRETANNRLNYMLQRIQAVDYHVPEHSRLSQECRDMLAKILVKDITQRLTIKQIYEHPWFLKNLPPGVVQMNDQPMPTPRGLQSNEQIIAIVQEARTKQSAVQIGGLTVETDNYLDNLIEEEM